MAEYRRRKNSDTWHWCPKCQHWPKGTGQYDTRRSKPGSGELCNECQAKARAGACGA